MQKVIPLDEVKEPVKRFFKHLDVSDETSMVKVNGKNVYLVVRPAAEPASSDEPWTDKKNRRRYQLIENELARTITPIEIVELEELTQLMRQYRDRVAPMPLEHVRQLHDELMKLA